MPRGDHEVFELGDLVLEGGATLRVARLAYTTFGTLNSDRSNAIIYPTWYSGRHWENEWLIGPGMALDPARWFVVVPNMLGNGYRPRRATPHRRTTGRASRTSTCATTWRRSTGWSPSGSASSGWPA